MNEKESQELYQEIFGGDRIERWKSWEGNGYAKSGVPKGRDHPLAEIPKVKKCWKGGVTVGISGPAHRTGRLQPKRESRVR